MKIRLVLFLCASLFISTAASAMSLSQYVPEDAYFMMNVHFSTIVNNEEIKGFLEEFFETRGRDQSEFYDQIGVNPMDDFHYLMVFVDSTQKAGIIAHGSFDNIRISQAIAEDEALSAVYTQGQLYGFGIVTNEINPDGNMLFIDQRTAAFGSLRTLQKIARLAREEISPVSSLESYQAIVKDADLNSDIWGVILPEDGWVDRTNLAIEGLSDMVSAFFSIDYNPAENFLLIFTGMVEEHEQLDRFGDALDEMLEATQIWTGTVPEIQQLLARARVLDDQETMASLVLKVPSQMLKKNILAALERVSEDPSEE